ncbi:hypothetical protein SOVF_199290 [Spinacia oleracea]|nr:hypothetical protein SOVF_199290 [Spinacia oleracea]
MVGSSLKLAFFVVLLASASFLVPYGVEARGKKSCAPPPAPASPLAPAPPPYQIHGCGYPCSDSNDCDWPCTLCCWQNQTCCYDLPMDGLTQTHI